MRQQGMAFIDLDDTLLPTQLLYNSCKAAFGAVMVALGFGREQALLRLDAVDRSHAELAPGDCLSTCPSLRFQGRFTSSLRETYAQLALEAGRSVDKREAAIVAAVADGVFRCAMPAYPGAAAALARLREVIPTAIYTMGDYDLQIRRVADDCLEELVDYLKIVPRKTPEALEGVCCEVGVDPARCWMIGNSLRSDILPAREVGLRTILVPGGWAYDRVGAVPEDVLVAESFAQAVSMVLSEVVMEGLA